MTPRAGAKVPRWTLAVAAFAVFVILFLIENALMVEEVSRAGKVIHAWGAKEFRIALGRMLPKFIGLMVAMWVLPFGVRRFRSHRSRGTPPADSAE